jgi:hypothetical protein
MNAEGPSLTKLTDSTRPQYAIGSAVRFRWIVPTGSTAIDFNLFFHGARGRQHQLIQYVTAASWVADGTVLLHGITWDKYYIDIVITDTVPGLYSICLNGNGRHYLEPDGSRNFYTEADGNQYHHDGGFLLTPASRKHYDDLPDRTELFSRVAGEKAWYADEFVTGGQLEAGTGIAIKYRTSAGVATGYATDATKAWNIIVEATATLEVEKENVSGITLSTGVPISWTSGTVTSAVSRISYATELEYTLDGTLARTAIFPATAYSPSESIPIALEVIESPTGTVHLSARTLHSGLWVSHDDGVTVTQKDAGTANGTIQHIRFVDTASVSWTVTEGAQNQTYGGNRHGVTVEAAVAVYSGWRISDDALDFDLITDGEEVQFIGLNGVTTNLVIGTPNQMEINRPLQIQEGSVDVGAPDTVTLNFDSGTATNVTHTEDVLIEVVDDTGGKRTVTAKSKPSAVSFHAIKTMWKSRDIGGFENMLGAYATGAGATNIEYYNIGFAGQDGYGSYEKILEHGTAISEGTALALVQLPIHPVHPLPKPLDINDDGVYDVNATVYGQHFVSVDLCGVNGAIGNHRIDVTFYLYVNRGGGVYVYQFHDLYQWVQYLSVDSDGLAATPAITQAQRQQQYGHYSSIPWSIQGSNIVPLQSGDKIWGVLYFRGIGNAWRKFYVNMITVDVHKIKDAMPITWLLPHDLSNDRPPEFVTLNWD